MKPTAMKTSGWTATDMPQLVWEVSKEEFGSVNPNLLTAFEAEIKLPNGEIALVHDIQYLGLNADLHRWSGTIKSISKVQSSDLGAPANYDVDAEIVRRNAFRKMLEDYSAELENRGFGKASQYANTLGLYLIEDVENLEAGQPMRKS